MASEPTPLSPPDIGSYVPPGYPRERDSHFQQFLRGPQTQIDELVAAIEVTIRSLQLPYASGPALDAIGWSKDVLGKRGTRGDDEYRRYLAALPNSFSGYNREKDIRTAVVSATGAEARDDIDLPEDVEGNTYTVTVRSWQEHSVELVDQICSYADLEGVKRVGPITYDRGTLDLNVRGSDAAFGASVDFGTVDLRVGDTDEEFYSSVRHEDGWGGFEWDSSYRWDIDDRRLGDTGGTDIEATDHNYVYDDEHVTAESPLSVGGRLSVGGSLSIEETDDSTEYLGTSVIATKDGTRIYDDEHETLESPLTVATRLSVDGRVSVSDADSDTDSGSG